MDAVDVGLSIPPRLLSKIGFTDDCWWWTAARDRRGYGRWWDGARMVLAHRAIYEHLVGEAPPELDHLCGNPSCVRPSHLEPVTHTENVRRWAEAVTHCKRGHEFTPANTGRSSSGYRYCLTCSGDWKQANYDRQMADPVRLEGKRRRGREYARRKRAESLMQ